MPDTYKFTAKDGTPLTFVGDRPPTDAEMASLESGTSAPRVQPSSRGALALQGTAAASGPTAANVAAELATNPSVPKIGAQIGRVMGGVAPTAIETYNGSAMGALTAAALSGKTAWAGGKAGWFTAKLAQSLGVPVAKVAAAVAPYAHLISEAAGAQGVNDLAQMAEPDRQDIGFMGVSTGEPRSAEDKAANPTLMNAIADKVRHLMSRGLSQSQAERTVMGLKR